MRNKITAGIFALLFGGLGVHKFYLGRTGWGFLYLLFCWTLIPSLVAFGEAIIFFISSDDEFDKKYNITLTKPQSNISAADELLKLHELKEKGIITESEYQAKKSHLMK